LTELEKKLKRPFKTNEVKWRKGKGSQKLAYVDARTVMHRLDDVFGVTGWQTETSVGPSGQYICKLSVWDDEKMQWVSKSNGADGSNFEEIKGGFSDAFKRAAVMFGIGRYLYSIKGDTLPVWATPEGFDRLAEEGKI